VTEPVTFTMPAEEAAALHQLAGRMLEMWGDETGRHVDLMTSSRRHLESGLRSVGWAPCGDGQWRRDLRPARGRR
jgi:hypothetical protein